MANRLYNKQVSPKKYQEGGKVKKPAAALFKLDKQTLLQFKDLMTGSTDAEINKNMKKFKDSLEKEKKKKKKSND